VASVNRVLRSLEVADHATRWTIVGDLGTIRRRPDTGTFYLDLRPYGRIYRHRGIPIADEGTAQRILEQLRGKIAAGRSLTEVMADYLPEESTKNLVPVWVERWIDLKRRETDAGDLSPTYLREIVRYAKDDREFSWWDGRTIFEIDYGALEDWSLWLADRGLAPKTRRNILGAFRSFLGWLQRRGQIREVPAVPLPRVDEHQPHILSIADQDAILAAIPEAERGIFLALAYLGLRPSEARALGAADYRDGWIIVDKACKGPGATAPIRGTKTGRGKRLPVPEVLRDWIDRHLSTDARLRRLSLFTNPRTGRRWTHWALRDRWLKAAKSVGLKRARLYEGTKHTMATDAVRRGVSERALQTFLGHADVRSTRRYAKLADEVLISVLRPTPTPIETDDLSRTCPADDSAAGNYLNLQGRMASPTGLEPVLDKYFHDKFQPLARRIPCVHLGSMPSDTPGKRLPAPEAAVPFCWMRP
jgi:integrase